MSNIFSSTDIRGRLDDSLTPEYAWNVGKALSDWLPEEGAIVVVGSQTSEHKIVHALVEGILLQGRAVIDGGLGDEHMLNQLIVDYKPAGSAFVGHDTLQSLEFLQLYQENGMAITSDTGLSEIAELVNAGNFVPAPIKGERAAA